MGILALAGAWSIAVPGHLDFGRFHCPISVLFKSLRGSEFTEPDGPTRELVR
jgi:hypothetical protein